MRVGQGAPQRGTEGEAVNAAIDAKSAAAPADKLRLVVIASAAGTVFEWYDFFVYGALATVIAGHFFANLPDAQAFVFTLLTFAAGFVVRPLGALVFGQIGDSQGRKGAFLITIAMMGLATFAIGLLPDYAAIGVWAPALLIFCRVLQGFALGGEYGGRPFTWRSTPRPASAACKRAGFRVPPPSA